MPRAKKPVKLICGDRRDAKGNELPQLWIEFDALIQEEYSYTADVPQYTTEKGFVVSDSIILKPLTLNMTLIITDTPVTWKDWGSKKSDPLAMDTAMDKKQADLKQVENALKGKLQGAVGTTTGKIPSNSILSKFRDQAPSSEGISPIDNAQGKLNGDITREKLRTLEQIFYQKQLVTIQTTDQEFKNMAITSIQISKTPESGAYTREIPIQFQQVIVTEQMTTTIPDHYGKSGETGADAGTANTSSGSSDNGGGDKKQQKSWLESIFGTKEENK